LKNITLDRLSAIGPNAHREAIAITGFMVWNFPPALVFKYPEGIRNAMQEEAAAPFAAAF
jgi:hypothetical protein